MILACVDHTRVLHLHSGEPIVRVACLVALARGAELFLAARALAWDAAHDGSPAAGSGDEGAWASQTT